VTEGRLNQLEVVILLVATPFLLFPSQLSVLALLLLAVPWVLRWRVRGHPTVRTPMDVPMLCLLVMVPLAVWVSPLPQESLRKLLGIVLGAAYFYGVANTARSRGSIWWWVAVLLAAGVLISLLALFGTDWANYKTLPLQTVYGRLPRLLHNVTSSGEGGFHPNEVGGALVLLVPVALSACLAARVSNPGPAVAAYPVLRGRQLPPFARSLMAGLVSRASTLVVATLSLAVITGVCILTQSRSAYLGLLVGLVGFGVWRSRWFLVALIVLLLATSGLVWQVGLEDLSGALVQVESGRVAVGRFEIWQRAVSLVQDFPYTGVGLNAFPQVSETVYPYPARSPAGLVPHAHNNLLQVGVDLGTPGLVAYVGLLMVFALCTWKVHRLSESRSMRLLAAGLFAGMLAHQVYGLTDAITLGAKPGFLLWVMWGLMAALWRLEASQKPAPEGQAGPRA
jgi:putative inorganic carbon (HCO3(-)) transporter